MPRPGTLRGAPRIRVLESSEAASTQANDDTFSVATSRSERGGDRLGFLSDLRAALGIPAAIDGDEYTTWKSYQPFIWNDHLARTSLTSSQVEDCFERIHSLCKQANQTLPTRYQKATGMASFSPNL
jgi:hypothetical protein